MPSKKRRCPAASLAVALAGTLTAAGNGRAETPGPFTLQPANTLAEAAGEPTYMLVDDTQEKGPAEKEQTPKSEEAPTSQPADEGGGGAWPPGLIMKGFDAIGLGKPMEDIGLRVYGYVEPGFTGMIHGGPSTHPGKRTPVPLRVFDAHNINNLQLNQLKLTVDRPIDTKKCFDLGGRIDMMYGSDARNIHSYGLSDGHSKGANPPFASPATPWPFNDREQFDLEQLYAEMWIKTGCHEGEGLDVIFGKFGTPLGAEVIDAPGNYLYSRGMLFGFAIPFTHTGVKVTYDFDATNNIYLGAVRGWDTFKDNNEGASWLAGFLWSSKCKVGDNPLTSFAFNFVGGPEQFSDPRFSGHSAWHANPGVRYVFDGVWTYRFSEKLTQVVNADYGYEEGVPSATNNDHFTRKRDADWYGIAYYLNYVFNDYVNTTGRAEWFRDHYGVRSGFPGDFYEVTTGVSITPFPKNPILKDLTIRPELRWDWSANNEPFAGHHNTWQMTGAVDVIYKF